MAEEVGMAVIEPVMKRVIRLVLYSFKFNKIVEELKQETIELKMTQDRVKNDVDRAKSNAEELEKDVTTWQMDAEKIIAEVERLEEYIGEKKSCFNGLYPNLFRRYQFGKQAMKKKGVMTTLREKGNFSRVSYFPNDYLPGIQFYETKDFMPSASARSAFNMIMKELKDDKNKITALYGMGGVGKTTLAVEVGKKAKELKLIDEVIMAVVSQNPSIEGIQGQIADMIGLRFEESSSVGKANRLRLRLEKMEKKVLIVLDDLWAKLDLEAIGIPSTGDRTNCKVLLTTRQRQVCGVMGSQRDIPLDVLTDEEAWTLFCSRGGLTSTEPCRLTDVATLVAKECKGLPLAIATVGKALKGKTCNEWEVSLLRLRGSRYVGIPDVDQDVYKCIKFSYDYLQDKQAKQCFMLCSLFPEDHCIRVEELVRYAYGLGLCRDVTDSIDRTRKELHFLIASLKASSLLMGGNDDHGLESGEFVKMHDIVRDVALWISSEDDTNLSMVRAGMGLEEWPMSIHYQLLTRVSLMNNEIAEHRGGLVCPRLNLLLLDENGCYKFPNDFFDGMKELQVLSVCHCRTIGNSPYSSLPQSIQHMTNLRTLRIEWLRLNDISVLGKLKGLEILSLRGSRLKEFPDTIGELNNLRVLDMWSCNSRIIMPANLFSKLYRLEELCIQIHWGDERSCNAIVSDLMSLSKLSLLSLEIDNVACLRHDICFPKHLVRYYIKFGATEDSRESSSYPTSNELILENICVQLNTFKKIIPGVNFLSLFNTKNESIPNIMPTVDQSGLDELISLCLVSCHNIECLLDTTHPDWNPATAFSRLYSICLNDMNSFREFIRGLPPNGLFKKLQKLKVCECHTLCTVIPAQLLRRLPELKEVIVEDCKEVKELFKLDFENSEPVLSNLETLRLCCLPELTRIWKGPTIEVVSLVNLRELEVDGCPKLTSLLSLSQARCLVQLQVLTIKYCNELKQIVANEEDEGQLEMQSIGHEATILLPQLKVLQLHELPNFISFWHENYMLPLPSLKQLYIVGCPSIGTLFIAEVQKLKVLEVERLCNTFVEQLMKGLRISLQSLSITNVEGLLPRIPSLVEVKELKIKGCKGVQELLQVGGEGRVVNASVGEHNNLQLQIGWKELSLEDVADLEYIWRGPSQILLFDKLSSLRLSRCHGLKKHLFTTSIARTLLQLCSLTICSCEELEQIFAEEETGDYDKTTVVTLPRLSDLCLSRLPNLINFCPSGYHFMFPSYQGALLLVENCPNNRTGFFRGTNARRGGVVHAIGEALCSTRNRGKCNGIEYRDDLPLYEKETEAEASVEFYDE